MNSIVHLEQNNFIIDDDDGSPESNIPRYFIYFFGIYTYNTSISRDEWEAGKNVG
jgi:hypothetical protein